MMVKMVSGRSSGASSASTDTFLVAVYVVGNHVRGSDNNMLPGTNNTFCSSHLDGYNRCVALRSEARLLSLTDQISYAQREGVSAF